MSQLNKILLGITILILLAIGTLMAIVAYTSQTEKPLPKINESQVAESSFVHKDWPISLDVFTPGAVIISSLIEEEVVTTSSFDSEFSATSSVAKSTSSTQNSYSSSISVSSKIKNINSTVVENIPNQDIQNSISKLTNPGN